jgi:biopolymer transport protein ExbD
MRKRKSSLISIREVCDINMTPLMDLTFILLITFIITFPMIEQGVPVNLPKGKSAEIGDKKARSITINAAGAFFLDGLPIDREELQRAAAGLAEDDAQTPVYVRADKDVKYEAVADVVLILHKANITRMALVTEE